MKKRYLECGKIVSTHGVKGEMRVQSWCDTPDYLCGFETLYLGRRTKSDGKDLNQAKVETARPHKNMVLLKLRGVDTLDAAVTLRGSVVYIDREDEPPLEEGVFFIQDLIGLAVVDADTGHTWGELTDVFATGANDVYQVTGPDGVHRLVPAIREVVLDTDIDAGVMRIRPLPGLFDGEEIRDAH